MGGGGGDARRANTFHLVPQFSDTPRHPPPPLPPCHPLETPKYEMASQLEDRADSTLGAQTGPDAEERRPQEGPPHAYTTMSRLVDHLEIQQVSKGWVFLVIDHGEEGGRRTPVVFELNGRVSAIKHIDVADEFDISGFAEHARTAAIEWLFDTGTPESVPEDAVDNVVVHLKLERTLETVVNAVCNRAMLRAKEVAMNRFEQVNGPSSGSGRMSCTVRMQVTDGKLVATATGTCVVEKEGLRTVEVNAEEHACVPMIRG